MIPDINFTANFGVSATLVAGGDPEVSGSQNYGGSTSIILIFSFFSVDSSPI
jgi:hypothetical protein